MLPIVARHGAAALAGLAVLLGGCASGSRLAAPEYAPALLSGAVFAAGGALEQPPGIDIVAPSEEMRAFVERELGRPRNDHGAFKRLMSSLALHGHFTRNYQADLTHTAAETFAERRGNCLSYTTMFVAMAREAGLDARFQLVHVPPDWDADAQYLIRYTHVNVVVRNLRMEDGRMQDMTVDFNTVEPDPDYRRTQITDEYATALFYGNLAVDHLRAGDDAKAFTHMRRAIRLFPANPDLWINLGTLYAGADELELATQAFSAALELDPRNRSALSALARAHEKLGNHSLAAAYADKARRYREQNPYYHFGLALAQFEEARYASALTSVNEAIRLKQRSGRFHFLKALTEQKLGDMDAARASFRRAEKLGNYRDLKVRYQNGPVTPVNS